jgi:hypothetical protein
MLNQPLTLLVLAATVATTIVIGVSANGNGCDSFFSTIQQQIGVVCSSLSGKVDACCPANFGPYNANGVAHDWPMQASYMVNLLDTLAQLPPSCQTDSRLAAVFNYLNTNANSSYSCSWSNCWTVFQFDYYILPRPPGSKRVESPTTLGYKSFAFSLMSETWEKLTATSPAIPSLKWALPSLGPLKAMFDYAIPESLLVSNRVCQSCFLNASYGNRSCPLQTGLFKLGWELQAIRTRSKGIQYNYVSC